MRELLAGSSRGYIDPNFPSPGKDGDAGIIIYGYTPALALGVTGAVYFGLATLVARGLIIKLRWDTMTFLVGFGTCMEVVGYIMRSLSSQLDPYLVSYFVVQYFFIVVAPVFFAAAIYLCLSRLVLVAGRHTCPLSPRAVFAIFLSFDIVTIVIQIAGAALIGVRESNDQDPTSANNTLIAGLAIQSASFAVFLVLMLACLRRLVGAGRGGEDASKQRNVTGLFVLLLVSAVLVELRTAFRLAESAQGVFGYLSSHEVYFGTLEFLPIVLAVVGLIYLGWASRKATAAQISLHASSRSTEDPPPAPQTA